MYKSYFHLHKKPFELIPDPEFIYLSRSHRKAITYLDYGIRERAGFILLTGDVGSGKTTLIRDLLTKRYPGMVLAKIFNTRVTSEQLLGMINEDFGLSITGKDKITLMRDLNDFLLEQYALGAHPTLIIDEAQNLSCELLEEVRMLSNLENAQAKLLQIVLVGQPELRETLAAPELMQLRQRISINCHLKALSSEEVREYIAHRMEVAGNRDALSFSEGTLEVIYRYSRGIPRLVNIICDFLMLAAFAEEVETVTDDMVLDVIGDLDFENHFWGGSRREVAASSFHDAPLLLELARRTDAIESDLAGRIPAAINEVRDAMGALQDEVRAQLGRNEEQVAELKEGVDSLTAALERLMANGEGRPAGLMRRIMGSGTVSGQK